MQQEQMSIYDWLNRDSWYGKMSPEPSAQMGEQTSKPSSRRSSASQNQTHRMCLCLTRANGTSQDASTMTWADGPLLGEYTMLSSGESPREENASLLSQILQDSAQPKYYLSERAVLGILTRANKRGKELPEILYEALVAQSGLRRDSYGQAEIENAGKVLRTLWEEIGEEAFVEWVRRTIVLVQQKKILLCGLCEQNTWRKSDEHTCAYSKAEQSESKKCSAECSVRYLWESGVYGSASQRQESDEQRSGELGAFMQELSCQTAPEEIFMRCLRSACEGSPSMQQALASVEEEYSQRMGYGVHDDDKDGTGESDQCE